MIKRPLDFRFGPAVLEGRKFTTIRKNPWPVGKPIMLYHWADKPYRSKQINVAPVKVSGYWSIWITHNWNGVMCYQFGMENDRALYETEGFESPDEMDAWFRRVVKPGETARLALMRFRLEQG
jgi:hypothetical protein